MSTTLGKISPPHSNIPLSANDPFFLTIGSTNNTSSKALVVNTGNSLSRLCFTAAAERVLPVYLHTLGSNGASPKSKSPIVKEEKKERVAVLVESNGSRFIRYRLNFDSPRTSEAAAQLGITFADCLKRPKENFFVPGVDEKIAQLRYDHHCLRVQDSLKSVRDLRNEIGIIFPSIFAVQKKTKKKNNLNPPHSEKTRVNTRRTKIR
jgi:hypothetical protein